jgi:hypothetical protein
MQHSERNVHYAEFEVLKTVIIKSSIFCLPPAFALVSCLAYFRTWRCRHVPPKRRLNFNGLHGVISQKELLNTWINIAQVISAVVRRVYWTFYSEGLVFDFGVRGRNGWGNLVERAHWKFFREVSYKPLYLLAFFLPHSCPTPFVCPRYQNMQMPRLSNGQSLPSVTESSNVLCDYIIFPHIQSTIKRHASDRRRIMARCLCFLTTSISVCCVVFKTE